MNELDCIAKETEMYSKFKLYIQKTKIILEQRIESNDHHSYYHSNLHFDDIPSHSNRN